MSWVFVFHPHFYRIPFHIPYVVGAFITPSLSLRKTWTLPFAISWLLLLPILQRKMQVSNIVNEKYYHWTLCLLMPSELMRGSRSHWTKRWKLYQVSILIWDPVSLTHTCRHMRAHTHTHTHSARICLSNNHKVRISAYYFFLKEEKCDCWWSRNRHSNWISCIKSMGYKTTHDVGTGIFTTSNFKYAAHTMEGQKYSVHWGMGQNSIHERGTM